VGPGSIRGEAGSDDLSSESLIPSGDTGSVPDGLSPRPRPSLLSSASLTYATQLAVAALSLVNVLIVSRALGPSGRGDVVFLTTISFLSAQFATLSVSESLSNIAGRSPQHRPALASNAVVLAVILGTVTAGVLAATPGIGPHVSLQLRVLSLAVIGPLILQTYFERLVLADYGFRVINASWLITPVTSVTVNAVLYGLGMLSVASAFSVWVAGQLAGLALLSWYIVRHLAGFGRPDPALGRQLVSFGLKAHGSRAMMWGTYRLDQWLVGALAGSRELGLYSVAVAWAEGLFFLPQALTYALRPDLVRLGRRGAGRRAAAAFRIATLGSLPLALAVIAAAPFLCVTVFGAPFHGSIADLRMLAGGALGVAALKMFGGALVAQRKPVLETIATATAFIAMIGLDVLLIPRYGGFGAALASTAAYTAGGFTVALIAARTLGIPQRALIPSVSDVRTVSTTAQGLLRQLAGRNRPSVPEGDAS
jgi:O-antigen/teichoic acid export membrane protein